MTLSMHIVSTFLYITSFICLTGCMSSKLATDVQPPEMVFVEGGTFLMGDLIELNNKDALPVHSVTVDDFYIGKYEVTFEQYDTYAKATGLPVPFDDSLGRGTRAAVRVNWHEAKAYCNYFGYRLPAETEWEYAARSGGEKTLYSGTSNPDSLKYYSIFESRHSFYVGSKKPNALGIYDMTGNVFEWIGSYYQYYDNPEDMHDLENSRLRLIRGGAYNSNNNLGKTFWRVGTLSDAKDNNVGFRCVVSANDFKF